MDCKKALQETDGDIQEALTYLQKKGAAAAEKKASRTAAEGLVATWSSDDQKSALLLEVNCETDFVSQNDQFQSFVELIAETAGISGASSIEELQDVKVVGKEKTVADYTTEQISTIGENITLRRLLRYQVESGVVGTYIHAGGQIGVVTKLESTGGADEGELLELARDIAMHAAAMKPRCLTADEIPAEDEAAQKEILMARAREDGKPENLLDRIVGGQMKKWREEGTLLSQPFVKDADKTVGELVGEYDGVTLTSFDRYEVGEGIEKEAKSLQEEVAEQLRGS